MSRLALLALLAACATPESEVCPEWPSVATDPDGVVEDSCGWYTLAVGDHLFANIYVAEPETPCSEALADGLSLNADPIYSAMSDDAPKYTYDVVADAAGLEQLVDVTCEDGTRWQAKIDVQ